MARPKASVSRTRFYVHASGLGDFQTVVGMAIIEAGSLRRFATRASLAPSWVSELHRGVRREMNPKTWERLAYAVESLGAPPPILMALHLAVASPAAGASAGPMIPSTVPQRLFAAAPDLPPRRWRALEWTPIDLAALSNISICSDMPWKGKPSEGASTFAVAVDERDFSGRPKAWICWLPPELGARQRLDWATYEVERWREHAPTTRADWLRRRALLRALDPRVAMRIKMPDGRWDWVPGCVELGGHELVESFLNEP